MKLNEAEVFLNNIKIEMVDYFRPFPEEKNLTEQGTDVERDSENVMPILMYRPEVEEEEDEDEDDDDDDDDEEEEEEDHESEGEVNRETRSKSHHDASSIGLYIDEKMQSISRMLDFDKEVDLGQWEAEAVEALSSIVMDVRSRHDRIPKRKADKFVTPPSTTPLKQYKRNPKRGRVEEKKKVEIEKKEKIEKKEEIKTKEEIETKEKEEKKEIETKIDIEKKEEIETKEKEEKKEIETKVEIEKKEEIETKEKDEKSFIEVGDSSSEKEKPKGYRFEFKKDYRGRDLITAKAWEVIDGYIERVNSSSSTVWSDDGNFLPDIEDFHHLLYRECLSGFCLDCYMSILCSPSFRKDFQHEINFINTTTQHEILAKLGERQVAAIKDAEFPYFVQQLSSYSLSEIQKINLDVLNRSRYILVPVNPGGHWFIVILDTSTKRFQYMNSLDTARHRPYAKQIVDFYCRYFESSFGYTV